MKGAGYSLKPQELVNVDKLSSLLRTLVMTKANKDYKDDNY